MSLVERSRPLPSTVAVDAQRVTVAYERQRIGTRLIALQDFSLTVSDGEFVTIVGPSGCGKSTFLNLVGGLQIPDEGEVIVYGSAVTGPGRDRALVFQDYALMPWRTVEANIRFGLEMQRRIDDETDELVARYTELVGLVGFEKSYPRELSGGMRQRVGLARALVTEPRILLMDEPFAAVDAITREVMQEEVSKIISRTGQTVVFVTHSIDEAITLGDRVAVISNRPGRVLEVVQIDLPRPRQGNQVRTTPEYARHRSYLWELLSRTMR